MLVLTMLRLVLACEDIHSGGVPARGRGRAAHPGPAGRHQCLGFDTRAKGRAARRKSVRPSLWPPSRSRPPPRKPRAIEAGSQYETAG
jgi:hypothetical protein